MENKSAPLGQKKSPAGGDVSDALDVVILPAGTLVKFKGLPFVLTEDAKTEGRLENYVLALSHSAAAGTMPDQAVPDPLGIVQTSSESSPSIAART